METREQVLNNLQAVKSQISRIMKVMDRQTNIVASFRKSEASIATTGLKAKIYIALASFALAHILQSLLSGALTGAVLDGGLMALLYYFRNKKSILKNIATFVLGISILALPFQAVNLLLGGFIAEAILPVLLLALSLAATIVLIKMQNKKTEEKNRVIEQRNAELQEQYNLSVQQIKQHRAKLNQLIAGWYPKDYCSMEAVNFFIGAITNYKADSMKEAIILFDDSQHKKKMLASQQAIADMNRKQLINQQEISKQMRFANMLSIANLSLQFSNVDAIERNTDAVNRASYQASASASRIADEIKCLR